MNKTLSPNISYGDEPRRFGSEPESKAPCPARGGSAVAQAIHATNSAGFAAYPFSQDILLIRWPVSRLLVLYKDTRQVFEQGETHTMRTVWLWLLSVAWDAGDINVSATLPGKHKARGMRREIL